MQHYFWIIEKTKEYQKDLVDALLIIGSSLIELIVLSYSIYVQNIYWDKLDEYGFKIRGRNIYNLFYVDDATLISKTLVMKVKRNGGKLYI